MAEQAGNDGLYEAFEQFEAYCQREADRIPTNQRIDNALEAFGDYIEAHRRPSVILPNLVAAVAVIAAAANEAGGETLESASWGIVAVAGVATSIAQFRKGRRSGNS